MNVTLTNKAISNQSTITAFDLKWLKEVEEKLLTNIGNSHFKLNDLAIEMNALALLLIPLEILIKTEVT